MKQYVMFKDIGMTRTMFDSFEEFRAELLEKAEISNRLLAIIKHEKTHYDMFVKLRYTPLCGYDEIFFKPFCFWVMPKEKLKGIDDVINVALAPRDPSKGDLDTTCLSLEEINTSAKHFLSRFNINIKKKNNQ